MVIIIIIIIIVVIGSMASHYNVTCIKYVCKIASYICKKQNKHKTIKKGHVAWF